MTRGLSKIKNVLSVYSYLVGLASTIVVLSVFINIYIYGSVVILEPNLALLIMEISMAAIGLISIFSIFDFKKMALFSTATFLFVTSAAVYATPII